MTWVQKIYEKIFFRLIRNRSGYTDSEIEKLKKIKWISKTAEISKTFHWFKVEMVKTNRCTVGWKEGQCLYFDFSGMLITNKCPKSICPHAIAALSPVIYSCIDRMGRGSDPSRMLFDHVSCTDPGFDNKGMGNNLMKVSYERIPFPSYLRHMSGLTSHLFFYSAKARGTDPKGVGR